MTRVAQTLLPADVTANRPTAADVPQGALFPSTDDGVIYQSDGVSSWDVWATLTGTTPGGAAGGVLAGTYPNPSFAADMATQAELDAAITALKDGVSTSFDTLAELADAIVHQPEVLVVACSDETTDITTGTAKVTFRMPFAMTLTEVRATVTTAPTGAALIVDINEGGASILSTALSIDASEKTSTTAATPAVISDSALADDAEMTIDFDQVGSTIAGTGVKVYLIGTRT